ncbi:MAG: signal peptidase I [Bacteroidaceae bacterium]|nr:signal peptidase I [Bacteroidaceae bacterium]
MKRENITVKRVIGIILDIVLVLMVLYIGATLYLRSTSGNQHASLFGFTTHVVMSDSMEPAIYTGNVLLVKEMDDYQIGDIIVYVRDDGMSIVHRIVSVDFGGYKTKGDNNAEEDEWTVRTDQVVGKVIQIFG